MLPRTDYDTLVVTAPGLERITVRELAALSVSPSGDMEPGAIPVRASLQSLYTMNLNLRTASRITVQGANFRARSFAELERKARAVAWDEWLRDGMRVRLRVTCRKSRLYHSDAVAERIAGAIGARVHLHVEEKDDDTQEPNDAQLVLVRLLRDECTIRFDSSGANLHRRGYRQATAKAPLRETLAAAMLLGAEWDPATPLLDPFCGSGTIAIEAALLARKIAPGKHRTFAFTNWPNFDAALWRSAQDQAQSRETARRAPIIAADRDAGAIAATTANAERAGVLTDIEAREQALSALEPPREAGWVVTNPPYGVRVGEVPQLRNLYATLGRLGRERLAEWHCALLSAHPALEGALEWPLEERFRTTNGGLNVHLVVRLPLEQSAPAKTAAGSLGIT